MVKNTELQKWSREVGASLIEALIRSEIVAAGERGRAVAIAAEEIFGCLCACEPADSSLSADRSSSGRAA